jgi:hypothetical protein
MERMPSGPELVEGEDPVREAVEDFLGSVQFHLEYGFRRSLPGLGALEGTLRRVSRQRDASQPMRIIRLWTLRR